MTRQEFLDELRNALQGKIDQGQLNRHLSYYDNYIMEEARKERSEAQVIEDLGSPWLIAKTLVDTTDKLGAGIDEEHYNDGYAGNAANRKQGFHVKGTQGRRFLITGRYGRWIVVGAVLLTLLIVARLLVFLLPLLVPIILLWMIFSYISGGRKR